MLYGLALEEDLTFMFQLVLTKKGWLVFWEMIRDFLSNFDKVKNLNPNTKVVVDPSYHSYNPRMNEAVKSLWKCYWIIRTLIP